MLFTQPSVRLYSGHKQSMSVDCTRMNINYNVLTASRLSDQHYFDELTLPQAISQQRQRNGPQIGFQLGAHQIRRYSKEPERILDGILTCSGPSSHGIREIRNNTGFWLWIWEFDIEILGSARRETWKQGLRCGHFFGSN